MRLTTIIARWTVRITGAAQVLLGLAFWSGHALTLVRLHRAVGTLFVLALIVLAVVAITARARPGLAVVAIAWAILVPAFGMAQMRLVPGSAHWVIRLVHLLIGLAAMGFADRLARAVLGERRAGAESFPRGAATSAR